MNKVTVLNQIISDYPDLKKYNPTVEKQFIASDGREYNTYLISSSHPNFSKLVAKGIVNSSIDLNKEKIFTGILSQNNINVPRLFDKNIVSFKYLLIEYIEGERLDDFLL